MKQYVIRKTLSGEWSAFEFSQKSRFFKVKNRTENDIFVSFENDTNEEFCFQIKAGEIETVAISLGAVEREEYFVKTIYVKGTGDVEITAIDAYFKDNANNVDLDVENGVVILGSQDQIEDDVAEINSQALIDNETLYIY